MFRMNNPTMQDRIFQGQAESVESSEAMTLNGTIGKTAILLALLVATAAVGWSVASPALALVGIVAGFGLALAISFKPTFAPIGAPIYALLKGLAVGAISKWYAVAYAASKYSGIVPLAVLGTLATLGVMLLLYRTRVIRVTQTFAMVVAGATIAIAITYLGTLVLGLFGANVGNLPIFGAGPIGIGFSVFVIVLAALNLALDFHVIETGVESGAPKHMEWYAGFGLLVTLVWLYLEMLRLLSKLARR